jgi:hypothetical protein
LYAGESFLIGDQYDPLSFYDGGIAYDHGWIGVQMIEAGIQQDEMSRKDAARQSVLLAADWAKNQEVVKNHNYTAKLIWLLAQVYNWSNDSTYRNELDYKLEKNLLPSVLMDFNNDGFVDGTNPSISFQDLTITAQMPGRNWDGHNSLPWYNAMNAWAITEAYVAFRDRGDIQRATALKPYVISMLDNLTWEINNLGIIDDQLGVRDLTYALLIGIWKVAQYENEAHPEWESAAWAMWNSGYFNTYSTHSVCVGLYLCVLSGTDYEPPFERELLVDVDTIDHPNFDIFPNPTKDMVTITSSSNNFFNADIYDLNGRPILSKKNTSTHCQFDLSNVEPGVYFVTVSGDNTHYSVQQIVLY